MQSVEEKGFCFTALDGGLADLSIRAVGLGVRSDAGSDEDLVAAIERILRASGAGIRVRHDEPVDSSTASHAASSPLGTCLMASVPGDLAALPYRVTRIRSFDPLVSSRLRSLDLAIVTPLDVATQGDEVAAAAVRPHGRANDLRAGMLEAACQYAQRFGRRRVQLLTEQPDTVDENADVVGELARMCERYPDLELELLPARQAMSSLVSGVADLDVVAANPLMGELVTAAASILAGAPRLATALDCIDSEIFIGPAAETNGAEPRSHQTLEPKPSACILSLVDMLVILGRGHAAQRIMKAWCRTLEHGSHTAEFSVTNPYAHCLDVDEFAAQIIRRLDAEPRTLLPKNFGADEQPSDARLRRNVLRLVHSR